MPEEVESESWATHLAYLSAREPENLVNHVRRIYLHLKLKQPDALYGAMLDLYLILGDKGAALRKRLLRKSKRYLTSEHFDLFATHWEQGLQRNEPYPRSQYSVLGNFFQGKFNLIDEELSTKQKLDQRQDPLEMAREELTFGDITVAQEILEKAILKSPHKMSLHFGLLEVYKHTRSIADLLKMEGQLGDKTAIARSAWDKTRQFLEAKG
jgi:hypothetical protein